MRGYPHRLTRWEQKSGTEGIPLVVCGHRARPGRCRLRRRLDCFHDRGDPRDPRDLALLRQRGGQRRYSEEDVSLLAEDLPQHRYSDRCVRHATGIPGRDRFAQRQARPDRSDPAGADRQGEVRTARHGCPPGHRRVRRDVPADDLPGLHLRRPGHQVAGLAGAPACQARQARHAVGLHRPDRPAGHLDDVRDPRAPAQWAHGQVGYGPDRRHRRSDHLPRGQRSLRLLREQARGRGGARGGGRGCPHRQAGPRDAARGQGCVLYVPLPGGTRRILLLRRRDRGVRHHERHRSDGTRSRHRRHVRAVAHRVSGSPGHARRIRVPGARRSLRDRCARWSLAGHHPVRDP